MKIISSYGVELRKQNIPIRQTLEIYRSAVRYLVEVYESVWEEPVSYTHLDVYKRQGICRFRSSHCAAAAGKI